MWSDFFYFTKTERIITLGLMVVIVLLVAGMFIKPHLHLIDGETIVPVDSLVVQQFDEEMAQRQRTVASHRGRISKETLPTPSIRMHAFDPNLADSAELREVGLSAFVAHNIVRYRNAGGRFRNEQKLAEIYGMDDSIFQRVKPFVRIAPQPSQQADSVKIVRQRTSERIEVTKQEKYAVGTQVDLNVADTTELKKIPGIGSVIAAMIVRYREQLGGYYDVNQLLEIKYLTPELLPWFIIGTLELRKIRINHVGIDRLRMHPYINFHQAKAFLQYRKKEGKIESLSPFAFYTEEFTEKDLQRIAPYISFD